MKKTSLHNFALLILTTILLQLLSTGLTYGEKTPAIFPLPQEIEITDGRFTFDKHTKILLPQFASESDMKLARFLIKELSDKFGFALTLIHEVKIPDAGNIVVLGTIDNPLVKEYCTKNSNSVTANNPGKEGYILQVTKNAIVVAGWDEQGAFYGLQSLRQIIESADQTNHTATAPCLKVRDWPEMPFRGIRLYIPGPENLAFFKRFLADFMALYKYNRVVMEVNCMRLDRHPEVNAGWIEFSKYMKYTRNSELRGIHGQGRNSGHQDAGDGRIVEKEDVREIVRIANDNYIEVIPEIPSLTHGYYLLTRHPELAEYPADIWPDTYCPSNPKTYELLFDVFDEYIEVIHPKMIHIGHDEWWGAPMGACPLCKGKDYSELFAQDVNAIHDYLGKKGIKIAMWGDHLLESVRGSGPQKRTSETGYKYETPGALRPETVKNSIPKDILIFNWFWKDQKKDMELQNFGFKQMYGNFKPNISNWDKRIKEVNVVGGAPSSWTATNEYNFGKDLILDFLGCANLLWSSHTLDQNQLGQIVRNLTAKVRLNLSGQWMPSRDGDPVRSIDLSPYYNLSSGSKFFDLQLESLKEGKAGIDRRIFTISKHQGGNCLIATGVYGEGKNPLPNKVSGIQINADVSSLIFLHACALPAGNQKAYFDIFNTFDSSDLLGWYEVVYEDAYTEIIPIHYGVNILEWNPGGEKSFDKREGDTGAPQQAYCYKADAVHCSSDAENPITFYAFEWVNPRFGKKIVKVNVVGSTNYESLQAVFSHVVTKPLQTNGIMLIGLSKVIPRPSGKTIEK